MECENIECKIRMDEYLLPDGRKRLSFIDKDFRQVFRILFERQIVDDNKVGSVLGYKSNKSDMWTPWVAEGILLDTDDFDLHLEIHVFNEYLSDFIEKVNSLQRIKLNLEPLRRKHHKIKTKIGQEVKSEIQEQKVINVIREHEIQNETQNQELGENTIIDNKIEEINRIENENDM